MYKTGEGPRVPPKVGETEAHLISLLKPQLEPVRCRYDSAADYIIDDFSIADNVNTVDLGGPTEDVTVDVDSPCVTGAQSCDPGPSTSTGFGKRKRTISNIYEDVHKYTKEKMKKDNSLKNKTDVEVEILQMKKKEIEARHIAQTIENDILREKLSQEKLRTKQEEINLRIKEFELDVLLNQKNNI